MVCMYREFCRHQQTLVRIKTLKKTLHQHASTGRVFSSLKDLDSLHLETTETRRLRSNAVRLRISHRTRSTSCWSLRKHKPRSTKYRCVVFLLLFLGLSSFAFFVVALEGLDGRCLLTHKVDHEGHGKVGETVTPGDFHNHVETDELVASVKHANVALSTADVDELSAELAGVARWIWTDELT